MSWPAFDDHGYRFTDRMVREDANLLRVATKFIEEYGGDFDFLVNAKDYLNEYGILNAPVARGILNCMRGDVKGRKLLATTPTQLPPVPRLSVVKTYHPPYIDLWCEWHYDYVMSTHKTAQVVHEFDRLRSFIRYFPSSGKYQCYLYAYCKPIYARRLSDDRIGIQFIDHVPADRRPCPACDRKTI
jgi:hypothetical protein